MIKAKPLHGTRPEVIGNDVAILSQLEKNLFTFKGGHFQTDTLLVTSDKVSQVAPFVPPFLGRAAAGERPCFAVLEMIQAFHADDLGTKISQERGSPRQRVDLFQSEDANTFKHSIFRHIASHKLEETLNTGS